MSEPEFRSHAGAMDADKRRDWFKVRAREAGKQGARWHRFHYDQETGAALHEAWKARPEGQAHVNGPGGAI